MNFLLLETAGKLVVFRGGELDGRIFCRGETIFVYGNTIGFDLLGLSPELQDFSPHGVWCLERRILKGRPAVSCRYFNKRSLQAEQRYLKIFNSDGFYYCGPRFPRRVRDNDSETFLFKKAA